MRKITLIAALVCVALISQAQKPKNFWKNRKVKMTDLISNPQEISNTLSFPKFKMTKIKGAPKLKAPKSITGTEKQIFTEKHGLAYPNLYDWNKDGLLDLLIGEFETGHTGSYIQVHINVGTKRKPEYTGEFEYAKDINGKKISAYYW